VWRYLPTKTNSSMVPARYGIVTSIARCCLSQKHDKRLGSASHFRRQSLLIPFPSLLAKGVQKSSADVTRNSSICRLILRSVMQRRNGCTSCWRGRTRRTAGV
jgi:hypothetical protein